MYEIDFSPPPEKGNNKKSQSNNWLKFNKKNKTKESSSQASIESPSNSSNVSSRNIFKSKLVIGGLVISVLFFIIGTMKFVPQSNEHVERVFSDVEFIQNESLSTTYQLNFESDTAKSIYTIEYQEFAVTNLKKIVSFTDNSIETVMEVIPTEIQNVQSSILNTQKDNKVLLVSAKGISTIQKLPIVVNYALHYHKDKIYKIQAFLHTDDDFMTIEKLKNSKFAKWEKKKIKVWDSTVLIFEAILDETIDSNLHHENDTLTLNNSDTIEAQHTKDDVSVAIESNTTSINTNSLSNAEVKNSLDAHETIIETRTDSKDDEE